MVASTALGVYGQVKAGQAQRRQLNAQASAADAQAAQVEDNAYTQAAQTREEAQAQARLIRDAAVQVRGAARAAFAGSGVRVDQGSAALVQEQIVRDSERDAALTILTGERRAGSIEKGGQLDAASLRSGAANARQAGSDARTASLINAAGTVLNAGAAYARWKIGMQPRTTTSPSTGYFGYGDPQAGY